MVVNIRRKNSRLRGSHTHGWGSKKKHRGAGHRGGRGAAGSGKRADSKKPSIWKGKYFGKTGFTSKSRTNVVSINLWQIEERLKKWLDNKLVTKDNDVYNIDLIKLGYNKILSQGKINSKLKIKVDYASNKALEKVKSSGGEIIGLLTKEEKSEPQEKKTEAKPETEKVEERK
tara:strand:+ start:768 stop:1286 length:519 start_codon:yes stop_codon:yes gene_type:complete